MGYKGQSAETSAVAHTTSSSCYKMQAIPILLLVGLAYVSPVFGKREISANGTFSSRKYYSSINVTNGGPWGTWTWIDMCPEHFYAMGYSIKMEEYGGASDDTALNGIRLFCIKINSTSSAVYTVESDSGKFGQWSGITWCPTGFLTAFQLKVEVPQGILDDTAANNIKFRCSSGAIIEGTGGSFGDYGGWSNACTRGGICGIETKQDPYHNAFVDDTALNDVRFFCCD
ncbi:vitelline membrane outer layer protein 1 homolog [Mauremys reevesii]|uniref:vitelline membrane outer layer protein 1 homolog n=1 Tax=Mauremys reevesii TaxID=260615 RepID=UPI00194000AB|nr:vitelline membrane outer layer protein 1 homolog [Mauremys reevesii]